MVPKGTTGLVYNFFDANGLPARNPCYPKDFCEYLLDSNGTIVKKNDWFQELSDADINSGHKLSKFLGDHIVVHINFPADKMEMNVIDIRYTFYDRIAKLGGTLGLCGQITGVSILTIIHLLVLVGKAFCKYWSSLGANRGNERKDLGKK